MSDPLRDIQAYAELIREQSTKPLPEGGVPVARTLELLREAMEEAAHWKAEAERLRALIADGYDGGPAACKYCGEVTEHWQQDEFTPAGYDCPHCGRSSSGSLLASYRVCTWHGPEGETCRAPATLAIGDLCAKHWALVEMLQEPPRSAE